MVKVMIGMSGSGKTYRLMGELVHNYTGGVVLKDTCVVERPDYNEYSHVFNPEYVKVIKPDSKIVDSLLDAKNMDIIIDCAYYSAELLEKVSVIVRRARTYNNNVTITFLGIEGNPLFEEQRHIIMNADKVLVGRCDIMNETYIEKLIMRKLEPMRGKFDFREII